MSYRQSVWIDAVDINGHTSTQSLHTQGNPPPDFGPVGAVLTSMEACMNASLQAAWLSPVTVYTPTPIAGPYGTVWDKAIFTWRSSAGLVVRTVIPGPGAIFLADNETVDLANPLVAAYVAACQAALGDSGGNPLAYVTSAVRCRYTPGGL